MTYEEKIDLILKAVYEAQNYTRDRQRTKLHLTADNGLKDININEVYDVLCKIRDEEKVIDIKSSSAEVINKIKRGWDYNKDYFVLDILEDFNTWFNRYLIKEKSKIENLSERNFNNVAHILYLIEEELELSQSEKIVINYTSSISELEYYEREDIDDLANTYFQGLTYLKNIGVIKEFTSEEMSLSSELTLNIPRFFEILENVNNISKQSSKKTTEIPISKDVNKLSYDENKGLLKLGDKEVKLTKGSFRTKLLELLLKNDGNRNKEWSWDEVIEEIEGISDADLLKENKKKFYPACDGIAKFIAQKTGINDLLIFNKSTVQVNPKYT